MKFAVALCGILLLQCSAIRHEVESGDLEVEELQYHETQEFMDECASCAIDIAEDAMGCVLAPGYPMWCYEGDIARNFAACVNWVSEAEAGIKTCRSQSDPATCIAESKWCKWDRATIINEPNVLPEPSDEGPETIAGPPPSPPPPVVVEEDEGLNDPADVVTPVVNEDLNDPADVVTPDNEEGEGREEEDITPGLEKQKSVAAPLSEPDGLDIDPDMDLDAGRQNKEGSSQAQERWRKATKYAKLQAVVNKEIKGLTLNEKKEVLKVEKEMDDACDDSQNIELCCTKQCFPQDKGWLARLWHSVVQAFYWVWEKISKLWGGSATVSCVATCIASNGPKETRLSKL